MKFDTRKKYPFLHTGELYDSAIEELFIEQRKCLLAQYEFNNTVPTDLDRRAELLKEMFCEVGENCFVEAPIHMNWGGNHVILGRNVYINYGLCCVDDTFITIGDCTQIGPHCVIATAMHPENPELRTAAWQYNKPVAIGKRVWIGANVTICPGVTIGDDCIIGAGSVVTRDIPAGKVAVGSPCRVLRDIKANDFTLPEAATK